LFDGEETRFTLPGLEQLQEIARGGMGLVYRAVETITGRVVAVKIPATRYWDDKQAVQRFMQEARSAALLEHPHILPVYEVAHTRDAPFFTMKFAGGGSLGDQAKSKRAAADYHRWLCSALAKVTDAVQFAHEHGVLHRDLKPANILFDEAGEPYVADFGLAKWLEGSALGEAGHHTRTITALGTPHYLAPEIAAGKTNSASTSADLYALGAILYEMLCGRPPHEGESVTLVLRNVADTRPDAPSKVLREKFGSVLPPDLEAICMKAIEREPQDRYTSAAQLAADLRRYLDGEGVLARPLPLAQQVWRWSRRRPAIAGLAAALIVVLAVSAAMILGANRKLTGALGTANARLRDSLISQSQLVRQSARIGQRYEALDLIRKAAEMGVSVELRNEAAAALAEPDMRMVGEMFRFKPTRHLGASVAVTPDFKLALCIGLDKQVAVRETASGAIQWTWHGTHDTPPDEFHLSNSAAYAALIFPDHWLEVWDTTQDKLVLGAQLLRMTEQSAYFAPARPFYLHPMLPLATGVDDKGVVWTQRLDTGVREEIVQGKSDARALRLTSGGGTLALAAGNGVEGYDLPDKRRFWKHLVKDTSDVMVWNSALLAVVDRGTREIVVIEDNQISTSFRGHDTVPTVLRLVPGRRQLFSADGAGKGWLWDSRDGRVLWQMTTGRSFAQTHESGDAMLLEGAPGHAMKWERAPERVFREFHHSASFVGVATVGILRISSDGRLVATFANSGMVLWDVKRQRLALNWRVSGGSPGVFGDFAPDGSAIYCSRAKGRGILRRSLRWDGDKLVVGAEENVPGAEKLHLSHISADGKTWVLKSSPPQFWKPEGAQPALPSIKPGWVISPQLNYAFPATASVGANQVLSAATGLPCGSFQSKASGICFMNYGEHWLAVRQSSGLRLIDAKTWKELGPWPGNLGPGFIGEAAISADGRLGALEQQGDGIDIFTLPERRLLVKLTPPQPVSARAMTFSVDGEKIFVLGANHRLFEWNLKALNEELGRLGLGW